MAARTVDIASVEACNRFFGVVARHPQVSVVDLSRTDAELRVPLRFGFYAVVLKAHDCEDAACGQKRCDFSDGTLLFLAPGATLDLNEKEAVSAVWLLAFDPALTSCTTALHMGDYTFFHYLKEEALHVSRRERTVFEQCLERIRGELGQTADCYSRVFLSREIELLLDYCSRFYDRQFIVREEENRNILQRLERIVDDYFIIDRMNRGLPSAAYCAGQLGVSQTYLSDLLQHDTGETLSEYVQVRRMELARQWLVRTNKSIPQITRDLKFSSVSYFSRLFCQLTGCTPDEYKRPN